jgi:hypothetical protein
VTLAVPSRSPPETEDGTETDDGTGSDTSGTDEDSESKETPDTEHAVGDDDRPQHMTYHFTNCRHVFLNAFNAHGVKVRNAGNNAPQVICMSSPFFLLAISVLMKSGPNLQIPIHQHHQ